MWLFGVDMENWRYFGSTGSKTNFPSLFSYSPTMNLYIAVASSVQRLWVRRGAAQMAQPIMVTATMAMVMPLPGLLGSSSACARSLRVAHGPAAKRKTHIPQLSSTAFGP